MLPAFEIAANERHSRCSNKCSDANQVAWILVISIGRPFPDPFLLILCHTSTLHSRGMPINGP